MFSIIPNTAPFLLENGFQSYLFENDFKALFPEFFLILSTIFLLIYGVILGASKEQPLIFQTPEQSPVKIELAGTISNKKINTAHDIQTEKKVQLSNPLLLQNISRLSLLSLLFTLVLLENNFLSQGLVLYGCLILDDFTQFLKILVVCSSLFSILISLEYLKQENINFFEYIILVMLSICSMLFLISSANLISMYLAIEFQSFCFYIMATSKRNSEFSTEAGLKYFLLGAFSSGILLFGCSLIYGFTGTTNFSELAQLLASGAPDFLMGAASFRGCQLGMTFIIVGFLFKLTAAPFHMWAPDVYEGAPTSVTAFFSIVPKISILAVFLRLILECFFDFMLPWQKILIFSSLASMIIGALAALSQNRIKRFLAFSSIGHVGYLLVGFCCGTNAGIQSLVIYLIIYIIMTIAIFAIVLSPVQRVNSGSYNSITSGDNSQVQRAKYIADFSQLGKTNPLLAFTLAIIMFSIAGIPPLAGFYSKAALFFAAMSSDMFFLAFVGVLTSVLSCFYYIRLVKIMYFESGKEMRTQAYTILDKFKKEQGLQALKTKLSNVTARGASSQIFFRISKENSITLGLTLFFVIFFLIYPSPIYLASHKVALALCA